MTMMSTPFSFSALSGEESISAGWTFTGRRLANTPSPLRSPSSPCSGRTLALGSSHFGPPTAPSSTALDFWHSVRTASVSATPWASIEQPPISRSTNVKSWPRFFATTWRTRMASAVTSGPMPSPGRTTMFAFNGVSLSRGSDGQRQAVLDGVGEGSPGRLDDVGGRAHGAPASGAALEVDEDAGDRAGAGRRVQDADLEVGQPDVLDLRVAPGERLAERRVERVDGAVPLGRGVEHLAVHLHLDHRLREDPAAGPVLDVAEEVDQLEGRLVGGLLPLHQERDRRLGGLEGEAARLERLDLVEHVSQVGLRIEPELLGLREEVAAAGELAHHHAHLVADLLRVDVLVGD